MKRPIRLVASALAATALTAAPATAKPQAPAKTPFGFFPAAFASSAIDGGTTSLELDPAVGAALGGAGISAAPIAPAAAGADGIGFPIVRGRLNPSTGAGRLQHTGGLRFARGSRDVDLTDFDVTIGRGSSRLSARVDGRFRLPVIRLVTQRASVSSSATTTSISGVDVHLSSFGAAVLNRSLHSRLFRGGLKLGTVSVKAQRAQIVFEAGDTSLALDAGAAAALTSFGVSVAPVDPAFAKPDGSVAFPIVGGAVRTATLAGFIAHRGGLTFSAEDGTELTVTDFVIDTTRGILTARVGDGRVDLLKLDLSAPAVAVDGDRVTVGNVGASLTKTAADALNATFGVTAFTEGLKLGVATVNGEAR